MKTKHIKQLRASLKEARRNFTPISPHELEKFAKAVGRQKEDRGKEPTWVRKINPQLSPPLSIPNHSKDVKAGTARSIIDQLLSDLDEWEQYLESLDDEDDSDTSQLNP